MNILRCVLVSVVVLAARTAPAEVRLARVFGDNMVLQQQMPIAVWGTADADKKILVAFNSQSKQTTAGKDGGWRVDLPAMKADGKSHKLLVKGDNTITLKNVVLGEVWLASGQSNMSRSVQVKDKHPDLRLFWRAHGEQGLFPVERDFREKDQVGWCAATPEALAATGPVLIRGRKVTRTSYGEVAYVFGRKIHERLKVPVGLFHIAYGGSTAEAWTPKDGIAKDFPFNKKGRGPLSRPPAGADVSGEPASDRADGDSRSHLVPRRGRRAE